MPHLSLSRPALLRALLLLCCLSLPALLRAASFAKGADVGWLSQMESSGIKFYDTSGNAADCLDVLKATGVNAIRLRVWVNPSNGWCGKTDVVNMARRVQAAGLRLMVDFHYSDSWADPSKQTKPAAWSTHSLTQLQSDVATHTTDVLQALKDAGITPEWVQIGNETNNGMLWDEGKASTSMANFAKLVTSGSQAAKAVFPSVKVIVHISNGYDNSLFRWIFDGLKTNEVPYDVIGMSLYPSSEDWLVKNDQCLANMQDMVSRYGKEVMICEVGMGVSYAAQAKAFITDLIAKVKSLNNNSGLGVFYWEPECHNDWQGYKLGAFGSNGRPTIALEAFGFPETTSSGNRLMNISTLASAGTGWNTLVAGFVISGPSPRKVLIRAVGPGLALFNAPSQLANPSLDLYDQLSATRIVTNDDWGADATQAALVNAASLKTGAFLLSSGSKDAALLLTLFPGIYTARVNGAETAGPCMVEVYDAE